MGSEQGGLDHVAIAVTNLDEAVSFYERVLGLRCGGRERVEDQQVDVAFFGEGPGRIELICPFEKSSSVAKFLERRGDGLHHICVAVPDLAGTLETLRAQGLPLIDQTPRVGAGGSLIAFVHPKAAKGVLLELKQLGSGQEH